jgi:8-oxo-dGTP diphosphatase
VFVAQREFPAVPLVGVGAVVVDGQGRVLLVKRGNEPRKGHWSIPGGLLELGESLVEGTRREVLEETGLAITPEAVIEVVERIFREDARGSEDARVRYHYIIVDYWASLAGGFSQAAKAASDAADLCWADPVAWQSSNTFQLEPITVSVIQKGWQMAREAGVHQVCEAGVHKVSQAGIHSGNKVGLHG